MSLNRPIWKLRDWIDKDKLDWGMLSFNPKAIQLLEENQDKINWDNLSMNENAINLLKENPDKICWDLLSININAINLLKKNPKKINWDYLSENKNAIELLKENPKKINWSNLSRNENAIHLLEANPEKIDWKQLSENKNAIDLLKANPEKIYWDQLALNDNPNAIEILEDRLEDINDPEIYYLLLYISNWNYLSMNENAIDFLKQKEDYIVWIDFSGNPAIFELDYEKMRINNQDMYEDLIKEVMKPSRVFKNPDYDYLEELFGD